MHRFERGLVVLIGFLLLGPAIAAAGNVGPMMIQNYGRDIDNLSLFRQNLGLGSVATLSLDGSSNCTATNGILTCTGAAPPVFSVFGRTGAVALQGSDVTGALGYTPLAPNGSGAGLAGLAWGQIGSTPITLGGYGVPTTGTGLAVQAGGPTINGATLTGTTTTEAINASGAVNGPSVQVNGYSLAQLLGSPFAAPTLNADVLHGVYPSMTWGANGSFWINVSNAAGQANWQKQESFPLPGDALGLYVSAAIVHSGGGGTGYVSGDVGKTLTLEGGVVLTISTVSGGAVTGITVTTPNMYGVCSPTTSAAPILANSGTTGSGATFDLTVLSPTIYAMRKVSICYSGNILQVENSVTTQTKDIGALSDGSLDTQTAFTFASGPVSMEYYQNYNSGPTPLVSKWYDQGGGGHDATGALATAPVLYGPRKFGNSVAVLFNSQINTAGQPYPQKTFLTIPAGVTASGANAAVFFGGGTLQGNSVPISLSPVSGVAADVLGLADTSQLPACVGQNSGGTAAISGAAAPTLTETASVYGCVWNAGVLTPDSTYYPAPINEYSMLGYVPGSSAASVTITAGTNCNVPANYTISLPTSGASETVAAYTLQTIATINADTTAQKAGVTAALALKNTFSIFLYQPATSACAISTAMSGGGSFSVNPVTSGGAWTFAGGYLGSNYNNTVTGNSWAGIYAVVPWAMTPAQAARFRQSVQFTFGVDGHIGAVVIAMAASNINGNLTAFRQDVPAEFPRLLGRTDIVVVNKSVGGVSYVTQVTPNFFAEGQYWVPPTYLTSGKPTNNIVLLAVEYNSLTAVGSSATEYSAIQTLGGYYHGLGYKNICVGEAMKSVTATTASEAILLQGLLDATPGVCDVVLNPLTIPLYDIPYPGPWLPPYFTADQTHVSALGYGAMEALDAGAIRNMLQ